MAKKSEMPDKPLTSDLRGMLKVTIQQELEALPGLLANLPTLHRINILCKLVGYVLPKVEAVSHKQGEPLRWDD